jgi:beta-glucuronidase
MIGPHVSLSRDAIDLGGLWQFQAEAPGAPVLDIAVPGSWNEQLAEAGYLNHTGAAWLRRRVFVPPHAAGRSVLLHFGSADYEAQVVWNDVLVGRSGSLKLPFQCDVTAHATPGQWAELQVRLSAELPADAPMQRVETADYAAEARPKDEYLPPVRFDFFPFGGLNRPVHLLLVPVERILAWRVTTDISGATGLVRIAVRTTPGIDRVTLAGPAALDAPVIDGEARFDFAIADCRFWCPEDPHLYPFTLVAHGPHGADHLAGRFGVRTVAVEGRRLLLNGRPIRLKGFGRHEDSAIHGRGQNLPMLVKDLALIRWCGANSIRTAHYPHDEALYDLADQTGLLVIDEVFSVNLDFRRVTPEGLAAHCQAVTDLVARDANHPCVIAWSLANEPGYLGEPDYAARSGPYWAALFAHARRLDPTRPLTHANVAWAGPDDPAFDHGDFLMLNRYHGWYSAPAQLGRAADLLKAELDELAARHEKPIFLSEFGADAMAGLHATSAQLFTEEYQADLLATYWSVIANHPACIGGHVWTLADFRTAQHSRRVVLNLKGAFTRARDPKRAAFVLRDLWRTP